MTRQRAFSRFAMLATFLVNRSKAAKTKRKFHLARSSRHRPKKAAAPATRVVAAISAIGADGDGVAIIDGARVFVPMTAPGDVAEIDRRGDRGTLVSLIEEGGRRASPPCPLYGACGGCSLQHLTRDYYRDWKRARIVDALKREGFDGVDVGPVVETPAASRRRAAFAVGRQEGRTLFGFNRRRSSDIVDIDRCLVLHPDLQARLAGLRVLAGKIDASAFDFSATLCDNGLDVVASGNIRPLAGPGLSVLIEAARAAGAVRLTLNDETLVQFAPPIVSFDGIPVTPPAGGFLQASREGEAALIALVKTAAAGARKVADLFSGCGAFALPLATRATVSAYDCDRAAIEALAGAAADAQRAGMKISPVRAEARDLFERPLAAGELKAFDAVVFDPPRAGAEAQAAEIARSAVPLVVGVSCNPSSFARDAAILKAGGYTLSQATPVDQFVYAAHVELVGIFRKG